MRYLKDIYGNVLYQPAKQSQSPTDYSMLLQALSENVDLSKLQMESANLSYSYIAERDLSNVVLANCNLTGAVFYRCNLDKASFTYCLLERCSFTECNFENAVFKGNQGNGRDVISLTLEQFIINLTRKSISIGCKQLTWEEFALLSEGGAIELAGTETHLYDCIRNLHSRYKRVVEEIALTTWVELFPILRRNN